MYALFRKRKYWNSMIYALLTRNFVVRIYALFPQIFLDWKAKSADIFTFWMYGCRAMTGGCCTLQRSSLAAKLLYTGFKFKFKYGFQCRAESRALMHWLAIQSRLACSSHDQICYCYLYLIVRRVPQPSESVCRKSIGLKKLLLGHILSWKRLSAFLYP